MHFAKFKTKLQCDVVQFVLNPVSNVTDDDHTESGFLWPICLQCCNDCDVNFPDQFLQNSHRMEDGNLVDMLYFSYLIYQTANRM